MTKNYTFIKVISVIIKKIIFLSDFFIFLINKKILILMLEEKVKAKVIKKSMEENEFILNGCKSLLALMEKR